MTKDEIMARLGQTDAYALVVLASPTDRIEVKRLHRVFPTYYEALAAYKEEGGVGSTRYDGPMHPLSLVQFTLPHCWGYDTEPHSSTYYSTRVHLTGGIPCATM